MLTHFGIEVVDVCVYNHVNINPLREPTKVLDHSFNSPQRWTSAPKAVFALIILVQ